VYWVRRLLLALTLLLLVVGVQRLLSYDGSGESDNAVAASTVGAPFEVPTLAVPSASPEMLIRTERQKSKLPEPEGVCDPEDVLVTPIVEEAHAYQPVRMILELTTTESPACEFEVSGDTVAVNVSMLTGARELLWSTQDCPTALAESTVVARQDVPGKAVVEWDGRQSDGRCSLLNPWVTPGDYLLEAVALGGTATSEQEFELGGAVRPTITKSVTPTPSSSDSGDDEPSESPKPRRTTGGSGPSPSASPTGG
jgi:hypothetical protein